MNSHGNPKLWRNIQSIVLSHFWQRIPGDLTSFGWLIYVLWIKFNTYICYIQLLLLLLHGHYFLTSNSFFLSILTAVCKAGSYSPTGLKPCFPCEKGFYQGTEGQSLCLKCRLDTTTSEEGSTSSKQCRGTYVSTAATIRR